MNKQLGAAAIVIAAVTATAALSAAAAVPTASAKSSGRVKLSVLPLPKSLLGSAARGLRLEHDSGVVSYDPKHPGLEGFPLTPNRSFSLAPVSSPDGRIGGSALDYGLGASGGAGVTEVRTSVDQYKTSADAKKGLVVWKRADQRVTLYNHLGGLAIANTAEKVAPVGSRRLAFLVRYDAANIAPLFGFDEQFTQGRYEADVTVWAGRAEAAKKVAPELARKLEARIKLALAGRLHAKPVKLPVGPKAGPPPGGPDLSPLALTPTDLGVQASDWQHAYSLVQGEFARSYYLVEMVLPGQLWGIFQNIEWFATANQASFTADVTAASFDDEPSVDLSSIGDGAEGVSSGYGAHLLFSSGRLLEFVGLASYSTLPTSDVRNIARTVADKINSAGLGS